MIRRAIVFYLGLTAAGVALSYFMHIQPVLFLPVKDPSPPLYFQIAFGVLSAVAVSGLSRLLSLKTSAGDEFDNMLRQVFRNLAWTDAITLALVSALAEEWLFRSVGVPLAGTLVSSVCFALLHIPPKRSLLFWPVMAFFLGYGFALWTEYSDSVLGATLSHFLINAMTLVRISRGKKAAD